MAQQTIENIQEWHYPLEADNVSEKPQKIELSPDADQKKALARRLDIHKIHDLTAKLNVQRNSGNMVVYIRGEIIARIEQKCIVSLAPVFQDIIEPFEAWYADTAQAVSFTKAKRDRLNIKEKGEQPMLEEHEDPEAIVDGIIDLGELVTQHLSLAIDPYPKSFEVLKKEKEDNSVEGAESEIYDNPFAALKDWRSKENKEDY